MNAGMATRREPEDWCSVVPLLQWAEDCHVGVQYYEYSTLTVRGIVALQPSGNAKCKYSSTIVIYARRVTAPYDSKGSA